MAAGSMMWRMTMAKRRKNRRNKRKAQSRASRMLADLAAIRGVERQEHFADGKPLIGLNGWFHPAPVDRNKKAEKKRFACRGKINGY